MTGAAAFYIVLFPSVNGTMWADSILKKSDIPHKMIPVPKNISADCGVCIRIDSGSRAEVGKALRGMPLEWTIRPLE